MRREKPADGIKISLHFQGLQQDIEWFMKITLTEGKNREIRRVMEALDLQVSRLIRVGYGPFQLGQMKTSDPARKALERALDDKDKRVRLTARLTLEGRKI